MFATTWHLWKKLGSREVTLLYATSRPVLTTLLARLPEMRQQSVNTMVRMTLQPLEQVFGNCHGRSVSMALLQVNVR